MAGIAYMHFLHKVKLFIYQLGTFQHTHSTSQICILKSFLNVHHTYTISVVIITRRNIQQDFVEYIFFKLKNDSTAYAKLQIYNFHLQPEKLLA